jgi:hypothetical protein
VPAAARHVLDCRRRQPVCQLAVAPQPGQRGLSRGGPRASVRPKQAAPHGPRLSLRILRCRQHRAIDRLGLPVQLRVWPSLQRYQQELSCRLA